MPEPDVPKWALLFSFEGKEEWMHDHDDRVYAFDSPESAEMVRDLLYDGSEEIEVKLYTEGGVTRSFFDENREGWDWDE